MSCPLCGANAAVRIGDHASYELYECSQCAVQFWWPLKNPGSHWYERDERYAGRNKDPILKPQWNHKKTIAFFALKGGSVLDVGCGVGNFLAHAKEKGWKTAGIDFDRDAIEAGKRTFGLENLEVADVITYAREHPQSRFDLITFFDVLEHIDNHEDFMAAVRGSLKERGHITMTVPHRAHAKWLMPADVPPRHLTRWDEASLTKFLEREGFEVVYMTATAATIPFIIQKLRFRFGKGMAVGLVSRARAAEGSRGILTKLASLLAKTKDTLLFGLPALGIWLALLPTKKRYIGLYAIARLQAGRRESMIETAWGRFALDPVADAKMADKLQNVFPHQALFELVSRLNPHTIIDIGAHIGTVSIPLAKKYKIIAFEPSPASFNYLQRNALLNAVTLEARNKGLSSSPGSARSVSRHGGNAGARTLADGGDIEISTLDAEAVQADFIKIGVEGMELSVLEGGRKLIEHSRPAIYFEINLSALRSRGVRVKQLGNFFKNHRYVLYIWDERLCRLPTLALATFFITPRSFLFGGPAAPFDVLALPKEKIVPARSAVPHLLARYFKSQYERSILVSSRRPRVAARPAPLGGNSRGHF